MEASIITVVDTSVEPVYAKTKAKALVIGRERRSTTTVRSGEARGDHTRFLEHFPKELNQGFGRTDADSRAAFAAQRLKWHGLQYNSFPLHSNVILESELS